MKTNLIKYLMVGLILILSIKIYLESDYFNLKCVISDVDSKKYCVRERTSLKAAADKLAITTNSLKDLVKYCAKNFPDKPCIKRLTEKFNPKKIQETLPTSTYTAYSENKGEKIAFCLEKKQGGGSGLIDNNTLMFVALHELAHVASKSVGHTKEFWDNFKFLLQQAEKINIYTPVDYKNTPQEYCGMEITDNPYYDH